MINYHCDKCNTGKYVIYAIDNIEQGLANDRLQANSSPPPVFGWPEARNCFYIFLSSFFFIIHLF